MAEKLYGNRKSGYKNTKGEQVLYPQYTHQTNEEYDEVVRAKVTGKPLSYARSQQIQKNIDTRHEQFKKKMAETQRKSFKVKAVVD